MLVLMGKEMKKLENAGLSSTFSQHSHFGFFHTFKISGLRDIGMESRPFSDTVPH